MISSCESLMGQACSRECKGVSRPVPVSTDSPTRWVHLQGMVGLGQVHQGSACKVFAPDTVMSAQCAVRVARQIMRVCLKDELRAMLD